MFDRILSLFGGRSSVRIDSAAADAAVADFAQAAEKRSSYIDQLIASRIPGGMPNTAAKIAVNEQTALRYAAVYACIRCISETKGSLPYELYEVSATGAETRVYQHDLIGMLTTEPNPDMTPMVWSETRQSFVLSGGNGYTEIVFDQDGTPRQLIPRHWSLVTPFRDDSGALMYRVQSDLGGETRTLDRSRMLHVPAMGNGVVGWSPIRMHSESIAIGMAKDRFAANYYGNSARPSLAVKYPGILQDEVFKRQKEELLSNYTGDNAHRPMMLEGGAEVTPLTIPFGDAMSTEQLEFSEEEVCRIFRVPPHMIGLLRRATFSNIEAQDLSYEKHTIRPWLVRDEQELKRKLIPRAQWGRFVIRHNVNDLLRADIKTRYDAYKTAIMSGFKTQNEVRQTEGLSPVPGGDVLLKPEAIFGKSGGKDSNSLGDKEQKSRRPDKRLLSLTVQAVRGMISREITHAERCASKPTDFVREVSELYEKHIAIADEKFSPFGLRSAAMRSALEKHRDELIALKDSRALSVDVPALAHRWNDDAEKLARQLLGEK